jgi:hypothetical protein
MDSQPANHLQCIHSSISITNSLYLHIHRGQMQQNQPCLYGGKGGGVIICFVMEAAKGMPYRLTWHWLHSCDLLSSSAAEI